MVATRHDDYRYNNLPFVLNTDLKRTYFNRSAESNWHEDLEIQLCTQGNGTVLLDGEKYDFQEDDIIVVKANEVFSSRRIYESSSNLYNTGFFDIAEIKVKHDEIQNGR